MSDQRSGGGAAARQDFDLAALSEQLRRFDDSYLEFLRVPSLSAGLYTLPAGGIDPQSPHHEDEVYLVLEGRAVLRVGDEDRPVAKGSIVFVAKEDEHGFHSIAEDLIVLVFFAPAEAP
jgi:quercetin dioxygenase-like cupin family protein